MSSASNGRAFGGCLKRLREKKNLKLNEVGIKLEIDPTLLSKYEAGTRFPKKERLDRIAEFFKVDKNELARLIAQDKQQSHYKRLSSESDTKNKKSKNKK